MGLNGDFMGNDGDMPGIYATNYRDYLAIYAARRVTKWDINGGINIYIYIYAYECDISNNSL